MDILLSDTSPRMQVYPKYQVDEIFKKIIENGATYASECGGDIYCFYCGSYVENDDKAHDNDCVFKQIEKIV